MNRDENQRRLLKLLEAQAEDRKRHREYWDGVWTNFWWCLSALIVIGTILMFLTGG